MKLELGYIILWLVFAKLGHSANFTKRVSEGVTCEVYTTHSTVSTCNTLISRLASTYTGSVDTDKQYWFVSGYTIDDCAVGLVTWNLNYYDGPWSAVWNAAQLIVNDCNPPEGVFNPETSGNIQVYVSTMWDFCTCVVCGAGALEGEKVCDDTGCRPTELIPVCNDLVPSETCVGIMDGLSCEVNP